MKSKFDLKKQLDKMTKVELIDEILKLESMNVDVKNYFALKYDTDELGVQLKELTKLVKKYLRSDNGNNFNYMKNSFIQLFKSADNHEKLLNIGLDLINQKIDDMYMNGDRRKRSYNELYQIVDFTLDVISSEEDELKAGLKLENALSTIEHIDNILYEDISELFVGRIDWELIEEYE